MRKVLLITLTLLLLSCNREKKLVLFDHYYDLFVEIGENYSYNYKVIGLDESIDLKEDKYTDIIISPALYELNSKIETTADNLYVLGYTPFKTLPGYTYVDLSHKYSYEDILIYIKKSSIKNVAIIVDTYSEKSEHEVNVFIKNLDNSLVVNHFYISENVGANQLEDFINIQENIDLWIINSDTHSLTVYDLLPDDSKIIINENSFFNEKNDNIIYTIDKNLEENINIIFKKNASEIYSVLKRD